MTRSAADLRAARSDDGAAAPTLDEVEPRRRLLAAILLGAITALDLASALATLMAQR